MRARTIVLVLGIILIAVVLVGVNYSGADSGRVLLDSELISCIGDSPSPVVKCLSTGVYKCNDPFIMTKLNVDYCSYCDDTGARDACCPAAKGDCDVDTFGVQCGSTDKYYYPDGYTLGTCTCVPTNKDNIKGDGKCNLANVKGTIKCQ